MNFFPIFFFWFDLGLVRLSSFILSNLTPICVFYLLSFGSPLSVIRLSKRFIVILSVLKTIWTLLLLRSSEFNDFTPYFLPAIMTKIHSFFLMLPYDIVKIQLFIILHLLNISQNLSMFDGFDWVFLHFLFGLLWILFISMSH